MQAHGDLIFDVELLATGTHGARSTWVRTGSSKRRAFPCTCVIARCSKYATT